MLARNGKQLFLIGRYLERAEQIASFTKVYYLTSMDAPFPEYKASVWEFLLSTTEAAEAYAGTHGQVAETEKVVQFIGIDPANPVSIRSAVVSARELARETRSYLSAGLWEHINCFYHEIQGYTNEKLQQKGYYSFAQKVEKYSYAIKGYIASVMLRNEEWKLLHKGYHLESAHQAATLLLNTLREIEKNSSSGQADQYADYMMRTMLESIGAYEMFKLYYQTQVNRHDFIHFVVFNTTFPKSILFNLNRIAGLDAPLKPNEKQADDDFIRQATQLAQSIADQYGELQDNNVTAFLERTRNRLDELAESM